MNKLIIIASFFLLFIYANGACIEGTLACTDCTDTSTCATCKPGFFVKDKVCAKCISGCAVCADATTCTTCADGYYKDTTCKACKANCAVCTTATDCTAPKDGYYISVGGTAGVAATLTQNTGDCTVSFAISGTQKCILPKFGWKADGSVMATGDLTAISANCAFGRGAVCAQPKDGFHIANFFAKCDATCKFCKSTTTQCLECSASGKLPNDVFACTTSSQQNCLFVSNDGSACTTCKYGYGISSGNCVLCNAAITGTQANLKCIYCGSTNSFYYDTTRRQLQSYPEDTSITTYIDAATDCSDFGSITKPTEGGAAHCLFWKSTDNSAVDCLYCEDGFGPVTVLPGGTAFDEATCTACLTGCDSCTGGTGTLAACLEPSDTYYLVITSSTSVFVGHCISDCIACDGPFIYDCTKWEGYYLAAASASLVAPTAAANDDNCLIFQKASTDKCIVAKDGYYVDGTTGFAVKCLDNCAICTAAAYAGCTTPASGFYKDAASSTIKACGSNCLTCTSSSLCTLCADGYGTTFDSAAGTCKNQCVSDCATCWSATFAGCDACATGFTANSTAEKCQASSGTTGNNSTGNGTGTTYGFLLSAITSIISLFLILIL